MCIIIVDSTVFPQGSSGHLPKRRESKSTNWVYYPGAILKKAIIRSVRVIPMS